MKTLLASSALFFAAVTGAMADGDGKVYPATVCQYWTADENAPREAMGVSQWGKVINMSDTVAGLRSQNLSVVCPLIKDNIHGDIARVRVYGSHDNCPKGAGQVCEPQTRCTLNIMTESGRFTRSGSGTRQFVRRNEGLTAIGYSQTPKAHIEALFDDINVPAFTSSATIDSGSMYVLFCQLGPKAELGSIYIKED